MGRKKGKGKAAKKAVEGAGDHDGQEELQRHAPHTFVFKRGQIGKRSTELLRDVRRVMEPYTASKLKEKKSNVLKDFVNIAGVLNVSYFIIFTKTEQGTNLRISRLPRGPTLTFRIESYALSRDVISSLKRPDMAPRLFQHHPLLVMNNLSGEGMHLKLMATMFQNMFPSINVNKVKLNDIRRCVLLDYDAENATLSLRHFNIRAVPVGMSRGVKKIIKSKVPNLARFDDVSEFLTRGGDLSESEAELDGPHNEVTLPQDLASRGNIKSSKSAIRLSELGPRLSLKLIKIEEGVCDGSVLYHGLINKTDEELELLRQMHKQKKKLQDERKRKQQENVKHKEEEKERLKEKSLAGMVIKTEVKEEESGEETEAPVVDAESDDDIEYYKQEVGENPEPELFPQRKGIKRKRNDRPVQLHKKKKQDMDGQKRGGHFGDKKHKGFEDRKGKHGGEMSKMRGRKDMKADQRDKFRSTGNSDFGSKNGFKGKSSSFKKHAGSRDTPHFKGKPGARGRKKAGRRR